jgi:hypothetical protein
MHSSLLFVFRKVASVTLLFACVFFAVACTHDLDESQDHPDRHRGAHRGGETETETVTSPTPGSF